MTEPEFRSYHSCHWFLFLFYLVLELALFFLVFFFGVSRFVSFLVRLLSIRLIFDRLLSTSGSRLSSGRSWRPVARLFSMNQPSFLSETRWRYPLALWQRYLAVLGWRSLHDSGERKTNTASIHTHYLSLYIYVSAFCSCMAQVIYKPRPRRKHTGADKTKRKGKEREGRKGTKIKR